MWRHCNAVHCIDTQNNAIGNAMSKTELACARQCIMNLYIDGLVQERRNLSMLAMELRVSCTNYRYPEAWIDSNYYAIYWDFALRCQYKCHKNIERHTAHTIVSWPNPKQWVIIHTSELIVIIRQSIYIPIIITRETGKLKTHSPTYCLINNRENMLNLTHTLDKIYDVVSRIC